MSRVAASDVHLTAVQRYRLIPSVFSTSAHTIQTADALKRTHGTEVVPHKKAHFPPSDSKCAFRGWIISEEHANACQDCITCIRGLGL